MYASTPINVDRLESELRSHPDRDFVNTLLHGLRHGFDTGVQSLPTCTYKCKNLRSCIGNEEFIARELQTELEQGHLIGPYTDDTCPYAVYRINPIGIVEGKYSGKKRIILDLSSPHESSEHQSINSLISKEEFSLSYVKIDDAISAIKRYGAGSLMNKLDVKNAFKNCPITNQQWLGISGQNVLLYTPLFWFKK